MCAAVRAAAAWHRRTHERIVLGLGGRSSADDERLRHEAIVTLMEGSRIVASLSALVTAAMAALPAAASMRLLAPIVQPDLPARIRVIGYVLIVAVVTHTLWLVAFGISGSTAGWGVRVIVLLAGLIAAARPNPWAAAIRYRTSAVRQRQSS